MDVEREPALEGEDGMDCVPCSPLLRDAAELSAAAAILPPGIPAASVKNLLMPAAGDWVSVPKCCPSTLRDRLTIWGADVRVLRVLMLLAGPGHSGALSTHVRSEPCPGHAPTPYFF